MSEEVYVCFDLPSEAVNLLAVNYLFESLRPYNYNDVSEYNWPDNKEIKSFDLYESSTFMSCRNSIVSTLVSHNIPFDLLEGAHSEQLEHHMLFREGMKEPFEYFGETPSVPVNALREIIASDPDYAGERIVEYLDMNFPEIEPLEDAAMKWNTLNSFKLNDLDNIVDTFLEDLSERGCSDTLINQISKSFDKLVKIDLNPLYVTKDADSIANAFCSSLQRKGLSKNEIVNIFDTFKATIKEKADVR